MVISSMLLLSALCYSIPMPNLNLCEASSISSMKKRPIHLYNKNWFLNKFITSLLSDYGNQ